MVYIIIKFKLIWTFRYTDNSYPIWLDDVNCDENKRHQHILSCSYRVAFGTQGYRTPCGTNEYLIINCGKLSTKKVGHNSYKHKHHWHCEIYCNKK